MRLSGEPYITHPLAVAVLLADLHLDTDALVAFLGLRQRRYDLAICAAFAAGLCRPLGMLLIIPAAIEVSASWRSLPVRERIIGVGVVFAAPAGAAAYLGWAQEVVGSFLLPLREQLSRSRRERSPIRS